MSFSTLKNKKRLESLIQHLIRPRWIRRQVPVVDEVYREADRGAAVMEGFFWPATMEIRKGRTPNGLDLRNLDLFEFKGVFIEESQIQNPKVSRVNDQWQFQKETIFHFILNSQMQTNAYKFVDIHAQHRPNMESQKMFSWICLVLFTHAKVRHSITNLRNTHKKQISEE